MNDPIVLLKELNPHTTEEIALSAPERLREAPVPMGGVHTPVPRRRRWRVLSAAAIGMAIVGVGGTAVAINHAADVDPDFSASGPLVTERVAPSDARWAKPGEPQLNLQSPKIGEVIRQEIRGIPLPPATKSGEVYGEWIRMLTMPGMTQHTRTEIRAEAMNVALTVWFRYWLSATPAERNATAAAMNRVVTSPYLDRTLGEPTVPTVVRAARALAAARAGDTSAMQAWVQ